MGLAHQNSLVPAGREPRGLEHHRPHHVLEPIPALSTGVAIASMAKAISGPTVAVISVDGRLSLSTCKSRKLRGIRTLQPPLRLPIIN